ncbi:chemotaxis protein CheD [bacterium]|nr:chemotaxis protein CheD [bacterium]
MSNSTSTQKKQLAAIGLAEMKISANPKEILVTYALGSCLGITIYDPVAQVGGLYHGMLPGARYLNARVEARPLMFLERGLAVFFKAAYAAGADKQRLRIKVAGGASLQQNKGTPDVFAIGERNLLMLRKILWQNNLIIHGEDCGQDLTRNLFLDIGSGRTWVRIQGKEQDL